MFDDDDFKIIRAFLKLDDGESRTGWKVMRSVFKKGGVKENNKVYYKLKKMSDLGLFKITQNSPKTFILQKDKVFEKRFSISQKQIRCLCLLIDGKYQIFQI